MTKLGRVVLPLLTCLIAVPGSAATSLEIDVGDETARGTVAWTVRSAQLRLDAGLLHHRDDGDAAHFGFHVVGDVGSASDTFQGGVGGRAVVVETDVDDGGGLALGGFLRYRLARVPRLEVGGDLYFAPDSLTSGDLDDYLEAMLRVGYRVVERAEIHVGYRRVEADFAGGRDATIDDGLHAGIRLEF